MAQVQYNHPVNKSNIVRTMAPPKKVEQIEHWWKAACRAIPQIPAAESDGRYHSATGYAIVDTYVSLETVMFTLQHTTGVKAYVVINRMADSLAS